MSHPYETYIEAKAEEYFSRRSHEPHCETLQPYKPCTDSSGFVYDVYIVQHCDCWLSENFENLTLSRKLDAMRALSHRFGMHSAACSRLKTEKITYRNRPETLRYACDCWLSVPMRPDHPERACPVCDKPLFYAPRAPEDTAKMACSDLNCVNAHGIVNWFPVDILPEPPVEYEQQPNQQEKDHTMGDLSKAVKLAETFEQSKRDINNFLAPFAEDYAAFITEDTKGYNRLQNFKVDTFVEVEGENFYLQGEEVYAYSEYDTPYLTLPFAFVENPQQFKNDYRARQAALKAKADAKKATDKAAQVERLKIQLAKAQAELDKAVEDGTDQIKTTAYGNSEQKLLSELAYTLKQG